MISTSLRAPTSRPGPAAPARIGGAARRSTARPRARRVHAALSRRSNEELGAIPVITAIKTPYNEDGSFDLNAFDALLERQVAGGAGGVVVGGTTGEGQLMSWDEHVMLIAHAVNAFGQDLAIIGNTGSNSTREAVHASAQGFAVGMDAALHINPYYGKTSRTGLEAHFGAVLVEGPTIIYNVPARTAQDIPESLILALSSHPNLLGTKECEGVDRIARTTKAGIRVWSGNDDDAHQAVARGGANGVISVASNIVPRATLDHLLASGLGAAGGRAEGTDSQAASASRSSSSADDLVRRLTPLWDWLFCEPNPIAINTALAMLGLAKPVFRLPYVPLGRAQRERGAEILEGVRDLLVDGVDEIKVLEDSDFTLLAKF